MDLGLSGRAALVCGASSGLGLASAEALAEEGANVVLFARRAEELEGHAVFIRSFNQSFLPTRLPDCESHKVYRSWKRRKKKESH